MTIENDRQERFDKLVCQIGKISQEIQKDIIYEIMRFFLKITPIKYYSLQLRDKILFENFYDIIIEIVKSENDLVELCKNHEFYLISEKRIKEMYKSINALNPNKQKLNRTFDKHTLKNGVRYNPRTSVITKSNKCSIVLAYDTETYRGKCKLLCRNKGIHKSLMEKDITEFPSFEQCIKFLTYYISKNMLGVYRFFWNIDFDIQAILKLYDGKDKLKFLDDISKGIPVKYTNSKGRKYIFKWLRSKSFTIIDVKQHRNIVFTDLYTFYNLGLGKAGKQYLDENKLDNIKGKQLNLYISYWKKHRENIVKYCIQDCKLTAKLGWEVINSIKNVDLELPRTLYSPSSISKQNFRFNNYIPSICNTPIEVIQKAYNCYYGGRFELFKRGLIKKGYLYDIVSQYPDFIKDLPDMYNGLWIKYKNLEKLPKERTFGYFLCQVDIPKDCKIPTLPSKEGIVRFASGFHWNWYTWYDLDLMRDYIIKIKKAYIYELNNRNYKPFKEKIEQAFAIKEKLKGTNKKMEYNTIKIYMNAIYGCFVEVNDQIELINKDLNKIDKKNEKKLLKAGILFNPIYASQITAFGRWSVVKNIPKEKYEHIIAIHTDSIITDKNMSQYLDIGKNLGQWNLEGSGKGLMINTGMYQLGKIFKSRGIPKKVVSKVIHSKKANWFKFCKKYKKVNFREFKIKHMKKIREAIIQDKNVINMNTMVDIKRSVNANSDSKRTWFRDFNNFKEMCNSTIESLPLHTFNNHFQLKSNPIVISSIINQPLEICEFVLKNQDVF